MTGTDTCDCPAAATHAHHRNAHRFDCVTGICRGCWNCLTRLITRQQVTDSRNAR